MIYKVLPLFENIRVFGCLCFATKLIINDKISKRAEKYVLVGYSNEKKGYKVYSLDNNFFLSFPWM